MPGRPPIPGRRQSEAPHLHGRVSQRVLAEADKAKEESVSSEGADELPARVRRAGIRPTDFGASAWEEVALEWYY